MCVPVCLCLPEQHNENINYFLISYLQLSYGEKLGFHRKRSNVFWGCNHFKAAKNIHPECLSLSLPFQMMTSITAVAWLACMSSIVFVSLILMIGWVQGRLVSLQTSFLSLVKCCQQRQFQTGQCFQKHFKTPLW